MVFVVAPVLHKLPEVDDEVNTTLPPVQKLSGPLAEIVGTGLGLTVTPVAADVPPHAPPVVTV